MLATLTAVTVMGLEDADPEPQRLTGVTVMVPPVAFGAKTNVLEGVLVVAEKVVLVPEYVQV